VPRASFTVHHLPFNIYYIMAAKKSPLKDLKDKSVKELVQTRAKLKQELHGLKMKHAIK